MPSVVETLGIWVANGLRFDFRKINLVEVSLVLLTLAQQARGYLRIQMFMKLVLKHEIDLWYNVNG